MPPQAAPGGIAPLRGEKRFDNYPSVPRAKRSLARSAMQLTHSPFRTTSFCLFAALWAALCIQTQFGWSLRGFFLTRQKEISQKGFAGASPLHSAPRRFAPRSASRRSLAPGRMAGHTQCGWRVSQKICPIFRDFSEKTIDNTRMF